MYRLSIEALRAHGAAPAVVSQTASLSYAELAARATVVGHALRENGVPPGAAVALVSTGRGLDEPVALAGLLAAGNTVVPLDAAAPPQRLAAIARHRGCKAIVCDEGAATLTAAIDAAITAEGDVGRSLPRGGALLHVVLDDQGNLVASGAPSADAHETAPHDLRQSLLDDTAVACFLHTSGSTGTPKPVPISWDGLDAFTAFWNHTIALAPGDRVLRVAELVFDLAWFDHLSTFRAGATLVIMGRRELAAGRALRDAIKTLRPTVIYGVPSLFMKLGAAMPPGETLDSSLRVVMFAGEIFPPAELHSFAQRVPTAELFNLYGPTETNVCTYHHVARRDLDGTRETPIGIACPYSPCELRADDGTLIEGPGTGELVVSGATTIGGGPYATRDRVARGTDGLYYFRGRIDRMVKIRGYRVEPGEVEAALSNHPAVAQAAAIAVDDPRLGKVLHAHVAMKTHPETPATDRDLRMYLAALLPPYMVPEKVFLSAELPRTTTGKIDYRALGPKPNA